MRVPSLAVTALVAGTLTIATARPTRAEELDHSAFSALLEKYVIGGRVDYGGLLKDRVPLDRYRSQLRRVTQKEYDQWSEKEQIAFWINLYNVETLAVVLEHPNTRSIRSVGWFLGAFRDKRILLPGFTEQRTSLNGIQDHLRRHYREPRVHFALVGAAQGCARLRNEAYTGARLSAQLDSQAREFVRDSNHAHWDGEKNLLWLSKAFDWYRTDFDTAGGVVATVARYADDTTRKRLTAGPIRIQYLDYDWSLNGKW